MPLRPALKTIHPRTPQPRQVRNCSCPHCAHRFEISSRAMSARCPACTKPLEFNDLTLRTRLEGDVSTMGHVILAEPSEMLGRLVCGQFTNQGRFEGRAVVYGSVVFTRDSLSTGTLSARSLVIHGGATAHVKVEVTPHNRAKPTTPAPVGTLIKRPARRLTQPLG